jgi:hypothetical protein
MHPHPQAGAPPRNLVIAGAMLVCLALAMPAITGLAQAAVIRTVCASGCDFATFGAAVGASSPGDGIEVMPGTYPEQVTVTKKLSIFAPADGPRPVITSAVSGGATFIIQAIGAGTTVSHLDIRGTGSDGLALVASGAVTATDLALTATGVCAELDAPGPSQLGPGVAAATTGGPCLVAGLKAADTVEGVTVDAPGTTGVVIENGATLAGSTVNAYMALVMEGGTVRGSTLNGTAVGVSAASSPTAALISDSVVTSSIDGGIAMLAGSNAVPVGPVKLRNVTAVASGSSSTGLGALSQVSPAGSAGTIDALNVIARGTANGVFGEPGASSGCGGPCAAGQVTIGYSNFVNPGGFVDTTTIGHNQSADPLLVNSVGAAAQDFHIASAGSPVIGAGTADAANGSTDRDGVPHPDPPAIGASQC